MTTKPAYMTPEWIEARREDARRYKRTPEQRRRNTEALRAFWANDPDARRIKSLEMKELWQNPEYRAKVTAAIKAASNTPESRARRSAAAKRRVAKTPFLGWMAGGAAYEKHLANMASPEWKEKIARKWTPERRARQRELLQKLRDAGRLYKGKKKGEAK